MINWEKNKNYINDLRDVLNICFLLNIKLKVVKFIKTYKNKVIKKILKKIRLNQTPNPDIYCNKKIKFGILLKYIKLLKIEFLATGHYSKIIKSKNKYKILNSKDYKKDQTYFIYLLKQNQIKKAIFPLSNISKNIVRIIANKINLINKNKKDSYGICFIKNYSFSNFLNNYIKKKIGYIIYKKKLIGLHTGFPFYTIGQKKNLLIKDNDKSKNSWYIIYINKKKNFLYVINKNNDLLLLCIGVIIKNISWIFKKPKNKFWFLLKLRNTQLYVFGKIKYLKKKILIIFNNLQWGLSVGQSIVFYDKNICIGGGIIDNVINFFKN